jgi:hypothetical protein
MNISIMWRYVVIFVVTGEEILCPVDTGQFMGS